MGATHVKADDRPTGRESSEGRPHEQCPVYRSVYKPHARGPFHDRKGPLTLVAGAGFEPATSGL
jgi:hypothetical protein